MNSNNEIELRSLIYEKLKCDCHDSTTKSLVESNKLNIVDRPFESIRKWTKAEQTSYIESIFLRCSLQPIIRFMNYNHTVIVDGYNRYLAIKNFRENKLALKEEGLKELKFLANKTFNSLTKAESDYFNNCDNLKIIDYSYVNENKILSNEEEIEIEKYLHVVYNTGLRLEIEELQKAQFSSDIITNKIREKINNDPIFLSTLETLKLYNGKKKRNKIDNILLNCRLLITSTYSNITIFSSTPNLQNRIEQNYLPNIKNLDQNKIYQDFIININLIYNKLINTQKWKLYPILHSKPFIDATYWLISVIKKDNLGDIYSFDFIKYLEHFAKIEEKEENFNKFQSHYKKNIYKKYYVVAEYYENNYGTNMSKYFEKITIDNNEKTTIKNIEDLYKKHFSFTPQKVKISDLLSDLKTTNYNLRPYYQRKEVMNISLSSKIIESILLGIKIPYILMYEKYENDTITTEVVDGQQRILSILGYLNEPFKNKLGEFEYSNKNGYALKNLRILYEFNNYKSNIENYKHILSEKLKNKILNTEIDISKTIDNMNNNFSAIDHFIRLNKNMFTIKENTYRMWSLTSDSKIIEYQEQITDRYIDNILPKYNPKKTANVITLKLACLFYYKKTKDITINDYNNYKVNSWLNDFNIQKQANIYKNPEKIEELRNLYYNAFENTEKFYQKITEFLQITNQSIKDLVHTKNSLNVPISNYYYLF